MISAVPKLRGALPGFLGARRRQGPYSQQLLGGYGGAARLPAPFQAEGLHRLIIEVTVHIRHSTAGQGSWGESSNDYFLGYNTPFAFQGRHGGFSDPDTGLVLLGARWYSPALSRFVQRDPMGQAAGPNVYAYCHDDPINLIDPTGSSEVSAGWYFTETLRDMHAFAGSAWVGLKNAIESPGQLAGILSTYPVKDWGTVGSKLIGGGVVSTLERGRDVLSGNDPRAVASFIGEQTGGIEGGLLLGGAQGIVAKPFGRLLSSASNAKSFGATKIEAKILMAQGLSRSEAFQQIRIFNAGNADGYAFHFTNLKAANSILESGELLATRHGYGGSGVYAGTTPTPNFFQRYASPVGWGLNPGSSVRIPIKIGGESITTTPVLPRWTVIIGNGDSVKL